MKKFGIYVDDLFAHGGTVSFTSLAAASSLDEAFEAERKRRYGTDHLAVEVHARPPAMDLTKTEKPYSFRLERERLQILKRKFGIEGLQLEGMAKSDGPKPKSFEALGTFRGRIARLALDVIF